MLRSGDNETREKEEPVNGTRYPVDGENNSFAPGFCHLLRILLAERKPFEQVLEVHYGMLLQVGHVQQVRQDVVAVEAHQRVNVEQHRRNGRHNQHVISQAPDKTATHVRPDNHGNGSDKELAQHTGRTHKHPVAFFAERPARGSVHVRERHEHHEHDANRVDLAAILLDGKGVPQFMQDLDEYGADIHPADIGRGEESLRLVLERVEIFDSVLDCHRDCRKPHQEEELRKEERAHPLEATEHRFRIKYRKAQEKDVQEGRLDLLLGIFLVAIEQLRTVLYTFVQEHIRLVKLGEHLDDFALTRDIFGTAVQQFVPDFTDRLLLGQARNELVCPLGQAVVLICKGIEKDIPQNPAVHLTMHPDTGPESNFAPAEPVPGFMEYLALLVENHLLCISLQKRKPRTGKPLQRANIHR